MGVPYWWLPRREEGERLGESSPIIKRSAKKPLGGCCRRTWYLKVKSDKNVSLDRTRPCMDTYNKNIKIHPRIHSTVNVIRTCLFILLSVLKVAQRVPPTCTRQTSRTADNTTFLRQHRLELSSTARCVQCVVFVYPRLLVCLLVGHFSGAGSGAQVVDVAPP